MGFDDLTAVKDDMVAFIAGHGMRRMNGFVPEDVPTVLFEEEDVDGWKDFVEHAKAANSPFVTMSEVILEPEDVQTLIAQVKEQGLPGETGELEEAQELMQHVGKTGYLQLGFAHGRAWCIYMRPRRSGTTCSRTLMDSVADLGHIIMDERDED